MEAAASGAAAQVNCCFSFSLHHHPAAILFLCSNIYFLLLLLVQVDCSSCFYGVVVHRWIVFWLNRLITVFLQVKLFPLSAACLLEFHRLLFFFFSILNPSHR